MCTLNHLTHNEEKFKIVKEKYKIDPDKMMVENDKATCKDTDISYIMHPKHECDDIFLTYSATNCLIPVALCPRDCKLEWLKEALRDHKVKQNYLQISLTR